MKGAHNEVAFKTAAAKHDIKIVSEQSVDGVDGLKHIDYKILKADGSGEYRARTFQKTVYDPNKITDNEMLILGQVAANKGFPTNAVDLGQNFTYEAAAGGINFRIYVGDGYIRNVHPIP